MTTNLERGNARRLPLRCGVLLAAFALLAGCAAGGDGVQNSRGIATRDIDPNQRGPIAGVGLDGQDMFSVADQMVRSMMQSPVLANLSSPPRLVIDALNFSNESTQQFNKNFLVGRLESSLINAAQGRMIILSGETVATVQKAREIRRAGLVDSGTTGLTRAQFGGDFYLVGRVTSMDAFAPNGGGMQRTTQIEFRMVDMETNAAVWAGSYPFARFAAENVIYR